jgi:hypothetical protein
VILAFDDNGRDLSGAMKQATIFCPRTPVSQAPTGPADCFDCLLLCEGEA